jgi:hypothetical protein
MAPFQQAHPSLPVANVRRRVQPQRGRVDRNAADPRLTMRLPDSTFQELAFASSISEGRALTDSDASRHLERVNIYRKDAGRANDGLYKLVTALRRAVS